MPVRPSGCRRRQIVLASLTRSNKAAAVCAKVGYDTGTTDAFRRATPTSKIKHSIAWAKSPRYRSKRARSLSSSNQAISRRKSLAANAVFEKRIAVSEMRPRRSSNAVCKFARAALEVELFAFRTASLAYSRSSTMSSFRPTIVAAPSNLDATIAPATQSVCRCLRVMHRFHGAKRSPLGLQAERATGH